MKAAFCSLSACGRRRTVSKIWIRVSASTWIDLSSGELEELCQFGDKAGKGRDRKDFR